MHTGYPNPGPQALTADALLTEPSPQTGSSPFSYDKTTWPQGEVLLKHSGFLLRAAQVPLSPSKNLGPNHSPPPPNTHTHIEIFQVCKCKGGVAHDGDGGGQVPAPPSFPHLRLLVYGIVWEFHCEDNQESLFCVPTFMIHVFFYVLYHAPIKIAISYTRRQ